MQRQTLHTTVAAAALSLAVAAIGTGCGWLPPPPAPEPENLITVGPAQMLTPDEVTEAYEQQPAVKACRTSGGETARRFNGDWTDLVLGALEDAVECRVITYRSRDTAGQPIVLTGMLYLPARWLPLPWRSTVPLIAYPHGTELRRDRVPSGNRGDEWFFGAAAALCAGFAVAMPDLPGMGGAAPSTYHPYCSANALAYAVTDMIRAVREAFDRDLYWTYEWNRRLFVLGYSEGAYAAMATVREIQLHAEQYPELAVTGSACMAGPFDLSGTMRKTLIDRNTRLPRPFFLSYLFMGYHAIYGEPFDPRIALNPVLLPDILGWMDGTKTGDEVDRLIRRRLDLADDQHAAPPDVVDPTWLARELDDAAVSEGEVRRILAENDLWSGWAPESPMLIRHSPDDECVPYANSEKVYAEFTKAGAGGRLTWLPIGRPGDGINHVLGGVIGIPSAILWFRDYFRDP